MTLAAVDQVVLALGQLLAAPAHLLPTFGHNEDYARPEIQTDARGYHWVIVERGQESDRQVFHSLEELLFKIFSSVTFAMASAYEVANRVAGQDTRILLFNKQTTLLAQLDAGFAVRCRAEANEYLREK
jgi:hypothetical protein